MTESAETTAGTEAASETCNSSLGTPISALAHKRVRKKTGTRIRHGIMPRDTLPPSSLYTPPLRPSPASSLHTPPLRPSPASFLYTPPSRPPSGVIPAQAGILTRVVLYEGLTVVDNYAEIPSRHISYGKCGELCVLQSLVWIRAIYNSWRPCPG